MLNYPQIDPVAFHLGPLPVHWYGLMYLVGFVGAWLLALLRSRQLARLGQIWTNEEISDLIFYAALGVIIGGRLGYIFFYAFFDFIKDPLMLFKIWQGGMAFHGGLLGVLCALWIYSYRFKKSIWDVTDFVAPLVPLGLAAGRIGNFINGELWGRISTVPWAMVFPQAGPEPRHPSQLYEFFLEGIVLFIILWWFASKARPRFAVSALFLLLYGSFRFFLEFFRQPDAPLGFIAWDWLTMGQLLSLPMIVIGAICLIYIYFYKE